ncbi:hypothetical protein Cenrod_0526 [Candidatus Symbiobacter mobilis CR]|uniref:Uncharacterized protein n=1 Tax=Candidatus Symbiobacter mobilis CR TaxID=946483 RepID=U5N5T3_9BURK|nr:hypothetical protein Cenrod_0526 [Candidatus Symbiobacter mobilis CR]
MWWCFCPDSEHAGQRVARYTVNPSHSCNAAFVKKDVRFFSQTLSLPGIIRCSLGGFSHTVPMGDSFRTGQLFVSGALDGFTNLSAVGLVIFLLNYKIPCIYVVIAQNICLLFVCRG